MQLLALKLGGKGHGRRGGGVMTHVCKLFCAGVACLLDLPRPGAKGQVHTALSPNFAISKHI
jgi:hypothetical protein